MRCPFPGMDPYLENPAIWQDFHHRFVGHLGDTLSGRLPDNYSALVEQNVKLLELPKPDRGDYRPDLAVLREDGGITDLSWSGGATAVLEAPAVRTIVEPEWEEVKEFNINIKRWPGEELITTIEFLSPWNKVGDGRTEFWRKRRSFLRSRVNWVEIDLLVAGERPPISEPAMIGDYRAVIARPEMRPDANIYSWSVRQPLPTLPIPLRSPDGDVVVDLGEVFATMYERGRFDKPLRKLSVGLPLAPLSQADREWAAAIAAGR